MSKLYKQVHNIIDNINVEIDDSCNLLFYKGNIDCPDEMFEFVFNKEYYKEITDMYQHIFVEIKVNLFNPTLEKKIVTYSYDEKLEYSLDNVLDRLELNEFQLAKDNEIDALNFIVRKYSDDY